MKLDPWALDPNAEFFIENDPDVKLIMLQLGIADLFPKVSHDDKPAHIFVAFDNHPTHWLTLSLYKGIPDYSPNHSIHKLVRKASPNGLLFTAYSKEAMGKAPFLRKLRELSDNESSPPLSQLPDRFGS